MSDSIMNRWKSAPILGEPNYGSDNVGSTYYATLPAQVRQYSAVSFGNGNIDFTPGANVSSDTFRLASKYAGYRLSPISGNSTTSPVTNGAFNVTVNWQNLGITPVYENWDITFQLVSGLTTYWTGVSSFNPHYFLPSGSTTGVTDNFTLSGVPAGTYSLKLVIKDPTGYRAPMPLFITGVNADGSYTIRTGIVVTSNGTPVANAGTNQTITLPTSSVSLSASGSTGTITSYLWTQISGPNTASITTPTTVGTTVTGLIQGVYIFQVSVNGGVSTSQVTITVNPSVPPGTNIFTTQTSANGTWNDGPQGGVTGIETAVKFQVSVSGYVTGIRFLKTSGNTGTHIGELYSYPGGTRLAAATFGTETATGWQYVYFATPVAITANTTYVAAYFSSLGNYEDDDHFFQVSTVNAPITGLADGGYGGPSGANGVYKYTATAAYPSTDSGNQPNYWVDIIFSQTLTTPCNCAPRTSPFNTIIQ
jgi:hypothetical protein